MIRPTLPNEDFLLRRESLSEPESPPGGQNEDVPFRHLGASKEPCYSLPSPCTSCLPRCGPLSFLSLPKERYDWGNVSKFASNLNRLVRSQLGRHGVAAIV